MTMMAEAPDSQLRTVAEACAILRCGRWKIYELQKAGDLELVKFGHRTVRVTQRSIDRLLNKKGFSQGD
jgi:excisionase family DNA binding protein